MTSENYEGGKVAEGWGEKRSDGILRVSLVFSLVKLTGWPGDLMDEDSAHSAPRGKERTDSPGFLGMIFYHQVSDSKTANIVLQDRKSVV